MKKNSLTTAVVAGIAGVAGFAGLASAVDLNPDGIGQVLVFPYYTVNKSQDTLLSVVNTTDIGKAVKVRFLEGKNSHECLDFNLFLSPYDVWTASIFDLGRLDPDSGFGTPDYHPYEDEIGLALKTADHSCTIPDSIRTTPTPFRVFGLGDTGPQGISRCREGHFEMISMGDIIPGSDLDDETTHAQTGVPEEGTPSCDISSDIADVKADLAPPTGGIYGTGSIVNVEQGTYFGYNADAIDGFYGYAGNTDNLYTGSGDLRPSLKDAKTSIDSATAYTFQNGRLITATYSLPNAIDSVSAVFMAQNIYNTYSVEAGIGANSDWVVTFPTKKFYVDPDLTSVVIAPFTQLFHDTPSGDGISCVQVGVQIFDREELTRDFIPNVCEISPCPPPDVEPPNSLCYETNVISFQDSGDVSSVLGSHLAKNIRPLGPNGHMILNLDDASEPHAMRPSTDTPTDVFHGLPATGFGVANAINNSVGGDGVLANYSGLFRHRESRDCRAGDVPGAACS